MNFNNQIQAYLDPKRELKFQELFIIKNVSDFIKNKNKNLKILDIGCGDGLLCNELSFLFPKCLFEGFDLSKDLISIANSRKKNSNLSYLVKDCRDIQSENYDLIIASGILSVFDDWENVLNNWLSRLSTYGALFIFGGFNPYDIDVKIKFKNNYNNDDWQTGLDIISIETFRKFSTNNQLKFTNLGEFRPPIEISKSDNPIRGFTIKDSDGTNLVINGALQVRRFFLFKLERI